MFKAHLDIMAFDYALKQLYPPRVISGLFTTGNAFAVLLEKHEDPVRFVLEHTVPRYEDEDG